MSRRRPVRVLSLLLVVALFGSAFVANADAKRISKAQKHKISKKLMRAVKKNPKVVSKRWWLKQASIVNFSLPTTIRLLPAKNAAGDPVSNDDAKLNNRATLDLGPSLGSRSVGLGGFVNATINFNDAFDSGAFGDVKINIPSGGNLRTTSVPLLANTNVSDTSSLDHKAPANQLDAFVLSGSAFNASDTLNLYFEPPGAGVVGSTAVTLDSTNSCNIATIAKCTQLANDVQSAIDGTATADTNTGGPSAHTVIQSQNVYVYATPLQNPALGTACDSYGDGCVLVTVLLTGEPFNGVPVTTFLAFYNGSPVLAPSLTMPAATRRLVDGYDPSDTNLNPGWDNDTSDGGCGSFTGNGFASPSDGGPGFGTAAGTDTDLLQRMSTSIHPGEPFNVGPGPYFPTGTPDNSANEKDIVLRTAPLSLSVTSGTATVPADDQGATGTRTYNVGPSGGRANLFGAPVNGLNAGNSVDVTVNLTTNINSIARQVDGAFPKPSGRGVEPDGNVSAYSNCRQAWTGYVKNYLTGIKLKGSLKIAPAVTADGKLRIAKVNLTTPAADAAKVSLAACLFPDRLYMSGNPFVNGDGVFSDPVYLGGTFPYGASPSLEGGLAANFNPLSVLYGAAVDGTGDGATDPAPAPDVPCNDDGGPLSRAPFNVTEFTGGTGLQNILEKGAAVGVSGDLRVTKLRAEVLIGNVGS